MNVGLGWEAEIRSSRLHVASAPFPDIRNRNTKIFVP
jgi:hypothetical protein